MNTEGKQPTKDPKVVQMKNSFSPEEQKIMDEATKIQEKKLAEFKKEEDKVIAELTEKFGLTREAIDEAISVEATLSSPDTGITTVIEAIEFYKKSELTVGQITFLAITTNSRANHLQKKVMEYGQELKNITEKLDTITLARRAEKEAREEILITPDEQ